MLTDVTVCEPVRVLSALAAQPSEILMSTLAVPDTGREEQAVPA